MTAWLVVNADDLGVSVGATMGVIRAHREGIVTSASLAVTTPHYQHAVDACVRACPELGVGLHFTLTSGKPVSSATAVPSLVGPDGMFRHRFMSLLFSARGARRTRLLTDVSVELDAQIARLRADRIEPDHINGERHVHLIPGIFEIVADAARRHGIRFVRAGRDIGGRYFSMFDAFTLLASGGFIKTSLLSTLSHRARTHLKGGSVTPDYGLSYLYTGHIDILLRELLQRGGAAGITEVMVHPGVPEANENLALGNREVESYLMSEGRRAELDACIAARGATGAWQLTNYPETFSAPGVKIEPLRAEHVDAVADLHMATLTGLITVLGRATARAFYQGCAESPLAVGFVAIEEQRVRGFVLGSTAPAVLKRDVVARRPLATGLAMASGILRNPRALGWLVKSFRGPDEGSYDASAAELTYLAVEGGAQGLGIGKQLVESFTNALRKKGIRSYELSVDDGNKAAAFYQRTGFTEVGRYREFGKVHVRYRRDTGAAGTP